MTAIQEYVEKTAKARLAAYREYCSRYGLERPIISQSERLRIVVERWKQDQVDREKARSQEQLEVLRTCTVVVTEHPRDAFYTDERLIRLKQIPEYAAVTNELERWELTPEVNGEVFLTMEGLTRAQFHAFMFAMRANPFAIVSDPRGENGGRVIFPNRPFGNYPIISPLLQEDASLVMAEQKRWERITPLLPLWRSQTHMVVYMVSEEGEAAPDGKVIVFCAPHVDYSSPFEFQGKKGEKGAGYYHQHAGSKDYKLGTGLYKLGGEIIEAHFKVAQLNGVIGGVTIHPNVTVKEPSSGSIVIENLVTEEIKKLVEEQEL